MPVISIITIVYNNKNGLEKTIKSVRSQTFEDKEYIVVDGGSTDGSVSVIESYSEYIDRWISEKDNGIYDAMNKGLSLAKGEWVIFMNSSDVFASDDVLTCIFSNEKQSTDASFIYSDYYEERNQSVILKPSLPEKGIYMHQSVIYKKQLHEKFGYYIVTKPIIISDFLFMASIPNSYKKKVNVIISKIEAGGISQQGDWSKYQLLCGQFIFNQISVKELISGLINVLVRSFIPYKLKKVVRKFVNG